MKRKALIIIIIMLIIKNVSNVIHINRLNVLKGLGSNLSMDNLMNLEKELLISLSRIQSAINEKYKNEKICIVCQNNLKIVYLGLVDISQHVLYAQDNWVNAQFVCPQSTINSKYINNIKNLCFFNDSFPYFDSFPFPHNTP